MTLESGTRLGPYRIDSLAGQGGMGQVYRGVDTRLDRMVAVKVLPPHLSAHPQLRERFDREARAISSLSHPNICALYDVGSSDGVDYLVMEFLEGETLAARIQRGPLPLPQAIRHGIEIAEALGKAHRKGIVHRDLKPGNVMLTASGAKLLDFGLARTAAPALLSPDAPTEQQQPLTAEGTIVGTFQYMAPEQLEGEEADARTDIFALGCLLYEMVTGSRAFEGRTKTSLIAAIVGQEPRPVRQVQPLVPAALAHVIARCMQKVPEDRWQSAVDVAHELRWIRDHEAEQSTAREGSARRWLLPAVGLAALIAGAGATMLLRPAPKPEHPLVTTILPPLLVEHSPGDADDTATLSPDGRRIAMTGVDASRRRMLWVRDLSGGEPRLITGSEDARHPFWSPDSRFVAFFAKGKLRRVALDGSLPVSICDVGSRPMSGDWNADGTILFSPGSGTALHRVDAAGGVSKAATTLDANAGETTHRWAAFLPDGKRFLYLAGSHDRPVNSEVNAVYVAGGDLPSRKLIVRTRSQARYIDGHLLFVRDRKLLAQKFDPRALQLEGDPIVLAEDVHEASASFFAAFSASTGGRVSYVSTAPERDHEIVRLDMQGKFIATIREPVAGFLTWSVSPDGTRLALSRPDPSSGDDIWIHDLARGGETRVTVDENVTDPVWSRDGTRMAYVRQTDRTFFIRNLEGDPRPEAFFKLEKWGGPASWSPDGAHMVFWSFDPKTTNAYDVWVLPMTGDRKPIPVAATTAVEFASTFSSDGKWLLYESDASGRGEAYAVSFPDLERRFQLSRNGGLGPTWGGPREVWYYAPDANAWQAVTLDDTTPKTVISAPRELFASTNVRSILRAGDSIIGARAVGSAMQPRIMLLDGWTALLK